MKQFLETKEKGFFCSAAAVIFFATGLVFYRMLTAVSFETTERPLLVTLFTFAAILFSMIASYKDFGKVPSILAYAASTVAFFTMIEGRGSYLAFYFSGDVMNTGLSPYMIVTFVCYLLATLCALFAVIFEEDKAGRPKFAASDCKVVLPMICVVGILAAVVGNNVNTPVAENNQGGQGNAQVAQNGGASGGEAAVPEEKYKKPTMAEEHWQEYSGVDYYNEDNDSKKIAYQLIGHGEVQAKETAIFDALLNFYEDGEMVMSVFGRGNAYQYFGYWTNVDDENLWFCVMDYMVVGMDQICTIDYGYELTGHFDPITVNVALGLADGGVFVRDLPAGGDGTVQYPSIKDWFASLGYEMPAKMAISEAGEGGAAAESTEAAEAAPEVLFSFKSDSENYLLDIYKDGTYTFTFKTAGLVENGTWTYHEWKMKLIDRNGKEMLVDKDNPEHEMRLHFVAATDERVNRDFTAPSSVWGVAFKGQGEYNGR